MNQVISEKLKQLPDLPGCYLMKDAAGTVIYVGKAVNLKRRVSSYFRGSHDAKTELLVADIVDFETVVVDSEDEALILEANLVKRHMPRYNILLRDDKHYPYLRLTLNEEYPRLLIARRAKADGSRYFGPYPNAGGMHRAVEAILDIFPLRTCHGAVLKTGVRACLNAHIGRCFAPCEGGISRDEYSALVNQVAQFLQGKSQELIKKERQAMEQAAAELNFEEAARHRDRAAALQQLQEKRLLDTGTGRGDCDIIAVACGEDNGLNDDSAGVVQVFFLRDGVVVSREHFFIDHASAGGEAQVISRFIADYYGGGDRAPALICCSVEPEDKAALEEMLSRQSGHKVTISVPQRGDKKRLLGLVAENARIVLLNHLTSRLRREEKAAAGLEELRKTLVLPRTPARIECYDISHIQGTHMVGSMTVFTNGVPDPKQYRRFKIKTLDGSNDFAALQEVLERRWIHGMDDRAKGKNDGFALFPDLLVIDGGKGQLSSVCQRLREIGAAPAAIVSLAKREEEVFLPGRGA
ncbi:MAG: excinuclease ABC subunit UvrC, partial [Firmicutes bacterium]|nr:excinuclease ABC subunit UvrC [Bacillota bacterium]